MNIGELKKIFNRKQNDDLKQHVYSTYRSLRYGLATIAILFPVILLITGLANNVEIQSSLSAYYHATETSQTEAPGRNLFVGILFAIGIGLALYKGFSEKENWLLNVAGLAAISVALFPMPWPIIEGHFNWFHPHYISAFTLFGCVAIVSIFCTEDTLYMLENEDRRAYYRRRYLYCALCMILSPLAAIIIAYVIGQTSKFVLLVEIAGILSFAYYWLVKSREFSESSAEMTALQGALHEAK